MSLRCSPNFSPRLCSGQSIKQLERQPRNVLDVARVFFHPVHEGEKFCARLRAHAGFITAPKRSPRVLTSSSSKWKHSIVAS